MTSRLHAIGLFEGIGGIGLALEQAGIPTVAAVEIDPACRSVLAQHFPQTVLFNDVTEVTGDQLRDAGFDPRRGILTAGWPCQEFSVAGRRLGLGGARSGLWWHVVRLLAETRPRWFLGENVPGLLSAVCSCPGGNVCGNCGFGNPDPHTIIGGACGPGRCMELHGGAMGAVLGSLAELGYGFAYRVLDAQYFGVPQRRRRVFIVGHFGDRAAPVQVLLEPESGGRDPASVGTPQEGLARGTAISTLLGGGRRGYRIDAESAVGGHLVPMVSYALRRDPGGVGQGHNTTYVTHALTSEGADASEDGTGRGTPLVPVSLATAGDFSSGVDMAQTVRAANEQPGMVGQGVAVRRLTPLECERLQGFPDGWTAGQADSARYRQLGNAVAVPCVAWITRRIAQLERAEAVT